MQMLICMYVNWLLYTGEFCLINKIIPIINDTQSKNAWTCSNTASYIYKPTIS